MLSSSALQTRPCTRCIGRWASSPSASGWITRTGRTRSRRWAAFHVTTNVPGAVCHFSSVHTSWLDARVSRVLKPVNSASLPSNVSLEQGVKLSRQGCDGSWSDDVGTRLHTTAAGTRHRPAKEEVERGWIQPQGLDTGIKIYNSLTRKKEPLILPNGRTASWYACGPTVYDHAHIGHASSYVRTDIIRRILMNHFNIDVVMVMGVTDIDDKIIKRSKELNVQPRHLTRTYENEFFKHMDALNIMPPTVKTRVTEHIPQILKFVQRLISNGSAYKTPSGSVYFDVQQYGRYGRLWTHSLDTVIRDALDKDKRSPRDFALWKAAKPDEPSWTSEWGQGRPGWHIECSTMASAIFGEQLDLHSGGEDLRFPHHENEMAQSEACFCTHQWTNYWLHTGHLHLKNDGDKMSKSLNNTVWVSDLLTHTSASEFRVFCMLRPYRQLIEYSAESMQKAVRIYNMWTSFISLAEAYVKGKVHAQAIDEPFLLQSLGETKFKVERALADDFDTPKAMTAIEELIKKANIELGRKVDSEVEFVSRSPGVIAAIVAYVERVLDMWGVPVSNQKAPGQTRVDQRFKAVLDGVIHFRSEVRNFALNPKKHLSKEDMTVCENHAEDQLSPKERKTLELRKVKPLLEACDNLRDDLKVANITIQDHAKSARWVLEEKTFPTTAKK